MRIDHAALSHPGMTRPRNEDRLIAEGALFAGGALFAVADGMGGHLAGERASEIALRALAVELSARGRAPAEESPAESGFRLRKAMDRANDEVYRRAAADPQYRGMGTTLTVALLRGDKLTVGHVGDSRLYRLREGELAQLTKDHSLVAEMVEDGQLSLAEAKDHPQRAIITRAIGTDSGVETDIENHAILPGDRYLLCTDGLSSLVPDDTIARVLGRAAPLGEICRALVEVANERGGTDNITVVVFEAR